MRVSVHAATAERLVGRYLDHVREHEPVRATRLGLPGCDGELPDLAPGAIDARVRSLAALERDAIAALDAVVEDADGSALEEQGRPGAADRRVCVPAVHPRRAPALRASTRSPPSRLASAASTNCSSVIDPGSRTAAGRSRPRAAGAPHPGPARAGRLAAASAPGPHLERRPERVEGLIPLVRDELPRRAAQLGVDVSPARDAARSPPRRSRPIGALLTELRRNRRGVAARTRPPRIILSHGDGHRDVGLGRPCACPGAWRDEVRTRLPRWRRRPGRVASGRARPVEPTERIPERSTRSPTRPSTR
jgi:hypothetical protein